MNLRLQEADPYVTMLSGEPLHFLKPRRGEIKIREGALTLAKTCRFNCQVHGWYSNAEHSFLGSYLASSDYVARYFLIHDLAESVFGDLTSPVKRRYPEYKTDIEEFQTYLYEYYIGPGHVPDEVEAIDRKITNTEMKVLRGAPDVHLWPDIGTYEHLVFLKMPWEQAYEEYMRRFRELFPHTAYH